MKTNHRQPRQVKKDKDPIKPKKEVLVTKHKPRLRCISTLLLVSIVLLFIGVQIPLIWLVWSYYIWVIPLVFFVNTLLIWLIVNQLVFRVLLFPFSLSIVKQQNTFKLNQSYCDELLALSATCVKAITTNIVRDSHKTDTAPSDYKHFSTSLHRLIDFIETFLPINE